MSTSSQSRQARRGSARDYERFSKSDVRLGLIEIRKDGGPENADAWDVKSNLDMESVKSGADRTQGAAPSD